MRARHLLAGLMFVATGASAHDFWLQPVRWQAAAGATVGVRLQVGHGPYRQRSPIRTSRITRFELIAPDGRRSDARRALHVGAPDDDATVGLTAPGTYMLVLETDDHAQSHLPAIRFNDYLRAEGLTPAIELRARTGRTGADGAENYSRHAKTIIQAGLSDARGQSWVLRPIGLELEIVPELDPASAAAGGALPVRVYYRGEPLAGALVKLNDLAHDAQPIEMHRSDAQGRAIFRAPGAGSWQFNVIWTRAQPDDSLTDFDTDFSSLSFGVKTGR